VSKRVLFFALGMLAFLGIVLGIAAWAALGDDAGSQRGVVLRNVTAVPVVVELEDGQTARIDRDDDATFVVRREEFPSIVRVKSLEGDVVVERELTYEFLARAEFRVSFDERGFFPTTVLRATPERTTTPAP
jgi:hypothetical protein